MEEGIRAYLVVNLPDDATFPGMTVNFEGQNYPVITTPQLESAGLGYILKWRAIRPMYSPPNQSVSGPWHILNSSNVFNQANEPLLHYGMTRAKSTCSEMDNGGGINDIRSHQDWINLVNSSSFYGYECIGFFMYTEITVRFVLIESRLVPSSSHNKLNNTPVELVSFSRPVEFGGGNSRAKFIYNITILQRTSTCTTGKTVVPLGMLHQNELPPVGNPTPSVPFAIELTKCPHVNIGYSFVAPTGVDFDNATGVVDLDSTATAQGVGIQIRHRNDPQYGNNTIVYNPSYATPSYTRNWPQCQSQGTCTNNQQTGVNHTIPMQAAVYRKDNVVVPGKINASVLFHIVYP